MQRNLAAMEEASFLKRIAHLELKEKKRMEGTESKSNESLMNIDEWWLPVGLGFRINDSRLAIKNYLLDRQECLASTAEIVRPKKKTSQEDLSTVTLGYINTKPTKKS